MMLMVLFLAFFIEAQHPAYAAYFFAWSKWPVAQVVAQFGVCDADGVALPYVF